MAGAKEQQQRALRRKIEREKREMEERAERERAERAQRAERERAEMAVKARPARNMLDNARRDGRAISVAFNPCKCRARVFGSGDKKGLGPQCTRKKFGDSEYCKKHTENGAEMGDYE
jgi:hypothetical protein